MLRVSAEQYNYEPTLNPSYYQIGEKILAVRIYERVKHAIVGRNRSQELKRKGTQYNCLFDLYADDLISIGTRGGALMGS